MELGEDKDTVNNLDIFVFWVENNGLNSLEMLKQEAGEDVNIQFAQKPVNSAEVKKVFSPADSSTLPQTTQLERSNTKTSAVRHQT